MKFFYRKVVFIYQFLKLNYLRLYLFFCSIFKSKNCCALDNDVDVIISLTSYYKRFSTLRWTLESLMQQKTKYKYKIILILSQEDIDKYKKLPDDLDKYKNRGLSVILVNENIKSYKKAFYTYDLDRPLITVDDDIYYPSSWLENLIDESKKTPDMIIAYRGHYMLSENENFLPYIDWMKWSDKKFSREAKFSFLPTGTSGVYYPVGALDGLKESKDKFLKICPHADDFWFKYLTVKNGYKARRVSHDNIHFSIISRGESLFEINVVDGKNDIQFLELLKDIDFKKQVLSDSFKI